ncbi:hypothetical protein P3X46_004934 [Hevea brasiliensis]|uniref:Uncharacterized protein n=1 Tax=Hevea brasiliensis TaxID=3981 RepID=A0ABQ9MY98_HEVBR|nr:hypothetical protein P3X46_004934 [Hevea brasiliensis]
MWKIFSPDNEAFKLAPCAEASQDENAAVSGEENRPGPKLSCRVMLSSTASKASGIKPEIAITIPKRRKIPNRLPESFML